MINDKNYIFHRMAEIERKLIQSTELCLVEIWRLKDEYRALSRKMKAIECKEQKQPKLKLDTVRNF